MNKNKATRLFTTLIALLLVVCIVLSLTACDTIMGLVESVLGDVLGEDTPVDPGVSVITDADMSIHFLELGNKYTGDCTLIKVGDVEVLIDAGSRKGSSKTICEYVDNYCTDGKLEYVVATHAHQDHIAGLVGTKEDPGIFEYYQIGTIIEFAKTNSTTALYNEYKADRDAAVKKGAKCYTALQCYKNKNGASRDYTLAEGVTLSVLYSYYYDHDSSNENNYSVCLLLRHGDNRYLFTGDLEEEGEEKLIENNTISHCKLFKGGHHGSETANGKALMDAITPEIVCVCCCCGSPEYTTNNANLFPSQEFVNHVMPHTRDIYVTSLAIIDKDDPERWDVTSMNGNIVVSCDKDGATSVSCSNNNIPFPDTQWFKDNRTEPANAKK